MININTFADDSDTAQLNPIYDQKLNIYNYLKHLQ